MENIFTYLKWRGDLTFQESSFNEVDNLILCAFTYMKIETFLQAEQMISLKDLYLLYQGTINKDSFFERNRNQLFKLIYNSKRFQNVLLAKYVNEVEKEKEKQFCAMTFVLPNSLLFVAYKGTDETATGWKEDFNMSYMKAVPSQMRAKEYLEDILSHTKKNVYVGGHSKGGNLAMYAFLNCSPMLKKQVLKVYNNDGPGFSDSSVEKMERNNRIITFIPKASLVGHLFENHSQRIIVESSQIGLFQHDLYSWVVQKDHLVYVKESEKQILQFAHFFNQLLKDIPSAQRKRIVEFLYRFFLLHSIEDIDKFLNTIGDYSEFLEMGDLDIEDLFLLKRLIPLVLKIVKSI